MYVRVRTLNHMTPAQIALNTSLKLTVVGDCRAPGDSLQLICVTANERVSIEAWG